MECELRLTRGHMRELDMIYGSDCTCRGNERGLAGGPRMPSDDIIRASETIKES